MADILYGFDSSFVTTDAAGNAVAGVALSVHTTYSGSNPFTATKAVNPVTLLPGVATGGVVTSDSLGRVGFFAQDYSGVLYLRQGANSWPVNPTDHAVQTTAVVAGAVAGKVDKDTLALDLRKQPGVVGDNVADDTAAINNAIASAKALGIPVYASGTFRINDTVILSTDADLSNATFRYHGTGVALRLGPAGALPTLPLTAVTIHCPKVLMQGKPGVGWIAGTVGIQALNMSSSTISIRQVIGFAVGLEVASNVTGNVYNNFIIGALDNNKINCWINPSNGGWANNNTFIGGRYAHYSGEGIAVPGTKHIYITQGTGTVSNMNTWLNSSIETGPGIVQYGIDVEEGLYNQFINPRVEANGTAPNDRVNVRWGPGALKNVIRDGYSLNTKLNQVYAGGSANYIDSQSMVEHQASGATTPFRRYENATTGSGPVMAVYTSGTINNVTPYNPDTEWSAWLSSVAFSGKLKADAFERIKLDLANGRTYYGAGTASVTKYVGNFGSNLCVAGSSLLYATHNTYDFGSATQAARDVYAARSVHAGGSIRQATRPVATAGFTLTADDVQVIPADATAGNINIVLPAAGTSNGVRFTVKKVDASANTVTVTRSGAALIDGAVSRVLSAQYATVTVQGDGTGWLVL